MTPEDIAKLLTSPPEPVANHVTFTMTPEAAAKLDGIVLEIREIERELLAASTTTEKAALSLELAKRERERFDWSFDRKHLEHAVDILEALVLTNDTAESREELSLVLLLKYQHKYASDLLDAITNAELAVKMTIGTTGKMGRLLNLGEILLLEYKRSWRRQNIDDCIAVTRDALDVATKDKRALVLNRLGTRLMARFEHASCMKDLEDAINFTREAVTLNDNKVAIYKTDLTNMLAKRYSKKKGNRLESDIEEAVRMGSEALADVIKAPGFMNPSIKHALMALSSAMKNSNRMESIEEAIRKASEALADVIDCSILMNPSIAHVLMALSSAMESKYSGSDNAADLNLTIAFSELALQAVPLQRRELRAKLQHNLSGYLDEKYRMTGELRILEQAITAEMKALEGMPIENLDRAILLSGMANRLEHKYHRTGALNDLTEAISYEERALETVSGSENASVRANFLNDLGNKLELQYDRTKKSAHLKQAIIQTEAALQLCNDGQRTQTACWNNLSNKLRKLYDSTKKPDVTVIKRAIECGELAEKAGVLDSPDLAAVYTNLSSCYSVSDLSDKHDRAIGYAQKAVEVCPKSHISRGIALHNLGFQWTEKYLRTKDERDQQEAIDSLLASFKEKGSSPSIRLKSAFLVSHLLVSAAKWETLSSVTADAIMLLPRVSPRSLDQLDQQNSLREYNGFASLAAAAAFQVGREASVALGLLELGRGIITGHRFEMRTDLDELRKAYPALAKTFEELRKELDPGNSHLAISTNLTQKPLSGSSTSQRYHANENFEKIIAEIRTKDGFHNFLLPPTETEVRKTALAGTIIIVNVSIRCDAIFVSKDSIEHIHLPNLNKARVEKEKTALKQTTLALQLRWLWLAVAKPVLEKMELTEDRTDSTELWPRVWWILTGQMCLFPIHAAASDDGRASVINRMVSSYSSSLKALMYTRSLKRPEPICAQTVLGYMDETPPMGTKLFDPLQHVRAEVEAVAELRPTSNDPIVLRRPSKNDILTHLTTKDQNRHCEVFHFAGHGSSNTSDPSKSCVYLEDGPLTVRTMMEEKLQERPPLLAYIAACWSGNTRNLYDEGIHLMGAFQVAGFRHVVGSLWVLNDNFSLKVARGVYRKLLDRGLREDQMALCLHDTIRELREQGEVGLLKTPLSPMSWAAYIHMGI
jgi:tetratricopeptide (TPR) repeat protein